jgi:ElaB/YqjD/DUF883 family membrane-anchored ribosome-binding protein
MTNEAEQLRYDIERTQRGLSADVDALTEKVSPSRIMHRRVGRARQAFTSMKDAVMGSASDATDRMSDTASTMAGTVSSAASSTGQAVSDAPRMVRRQTQGNPLAAGLIALGVGWLTASLLPPSKREQEMADQAKNLAQEHLQPVVGEMAGQLKENLREPAQQAVESVKSTVQDAGATVAGETRSAAEDVTGQARHAAGQVSDQADSTIHSS